MKVAYFIVKMTITMAKTLLEKMFYKPEYSLAILHMPNELQIAFETDTHVDTVVKSSYDFIMSFYEKKTSLEKEIKEIKAALVENGLLWVAYPKGKALQTDLNRDILHHTLEKEQLTGVSLVALNETWSAMRFKKL